MSPRSLGSSALLHGLLLLLVVFGLPLLPQEDILYQPQVISVDLKIAPVANAPTRRPTPPKKPEVTPPKPKPAAPKPEPVKEKPKKEEPKPKPPEPKPAPKPEPVKEKPKPKEPEKKPEPVKEKPKAKPEKTEPKEKEPTLEDILNSMEKNAPKEEKPVEAPAEKGADITSDVPYDPNMPLSQTVKDSIRNQLMKCWNYQGGAKDQENLVAHMQVVFREDGSIIDAKLRPSDAMRYNSDSAFRALVDSARRATKNKECVPLKGLPIDSYPSWSKVELVFDPDEMW